MYPYLQYTSKPFLCNFVFPISLVFYLLQMQIAYIVAEMQY
jgi:hypothetical protein